MYLEIKNIHKFFGTGENRTEVLKGINCNIEKGSICVFAWSVRFGQINTS